MWLFTNTETGEKRKIPLRDVCGDDFPSWKLDRTVSGDSLRDLDKYLAAFKDYVREADG